MNKTGWRISRSIGYHLVSTVTDEHTRICGFAISRTQRYDKRMHAMLLTVHVELSEYDCILGMCWRVVAEAQSRLSMA